MRSVATLGSLRSTIVTQLGPFDRSWHNRKTRGSLSVTVDHHGAVTLTTVLGQTRAVTGHDYSNHLADPDKAIGTAPPPF